MKEALMKMGAYPGRRNTVNFRLPKGSLPHKRVKNVWVSKGHTYDFIHVRCKNLNVDEIKLLKELLNLNRLPARHPLRRVLVRMFMKDELGIETFYGLVRPKKESVPKESVTKKKPNFVSIGKDEENRLVYETMHNKRLSKSDLQKVWLKRAYKRMKAPLPTWIETVKVNTFTSFDQMWKRTSSGRGKYCTLSGTELESRVRNYLDDKKIRGLFIGRRRLFGEIKDVLYVMDDCPPEHIEALRL